MNVGSHFIADYVLRSEWVNVENDSCLFMTNRHLAQQLIVDASEAAGATVLDCVSRKFDDGGGVTALCLLSESHASIHTWPEFGTFSIDFFTCGSHTKPFEGVLYVSEYLHENKIRFRSEIEKIFRKRLVYN